MRVLVVEDDRRLAASLRRSLLESRRAVDPARDGEEGLAAAAIDVLRRDRARHHAAAADGLEVTQRLRERKRFRCKLRLRR